MSSETTREPPATRDTERDSAERSGAGDQQELYRGEALAVRSLVGGALMGLANLVPGISGGTMLLATGVYPHFIRGVAEVTTLRFRAATILLLAVVAGSAVLAIVTLAGLVSGLVVAHRWVMYSLFIGLTLGGVPILWRRLWPVDWVVAIFALTGIALMAVIATATPGGGAAAPQHGMLLLAGLVAGSAMILPGLSGGYLFLVLGQYVTILSAISAARAAATARDWVALVDPMHVLIPVGLGAAVGVVGVSNLVKALLEKLPRPTLGVLLGLLLGAVIGLWPFVRPVEPVPGAVLERGAVIALDGDLVFADTSRPVEVRHWPTERFRPAAGQVAGSLGLIAVGLAVSLGVSRLGSGGRS